METMIEEEDQSPDDAHKREVPPEFLTEDGKDTRFADPAVERLREVWRQRCDMVKAQTALTLRIRAILRRVYADEKDSKKQKLKADRLYARIMKGADDEEALIGLALVGSLITAREPIIENRKRVEKVLDSLAETIPIYHVVSEIRGLGSGSLAAIVGECGDLSVYPNPAKVWKRCGLGLVNGVRQRKHRDKKLALEHNYNPFRRSVMWNVGAAIFKAQSGEEPGPYRKLYDERKEYELTKVKVKAHAHNRALRYVTKRLLKNLWIEWRALKGLQH